MSFDSQGNFYRVHNWEQDRQDNIEIVSDRHDQEDDNFAEGLSQCFCRDGRAAATGSFNMGNNKIQNLANATASKDAVNKSQLDAQSTSITTAYQNYVKTVLGQMYPVGSIYIGTQSTCPMASLISGSTWTLVSSGKALWTGNGSNANSTIAAGLPNITGKVGGGELMRPDLDGYANGAFSLVSEEHKYRPIGEYATGAAISFDASKSSGIYGNSTTVQPPAYIVNVWRRTA